MGELKPGKMVGGHYLLVMPLDEQKTSATWQAMDTDTGYQVTLTLFHPQAAEDDEAVNRFLSTLERVQAIKHKNVVEVLGFGRFDDGRIYSSMELLDGRTLADRLSEEPTMTLVEFAQIAALALQGIGALHSAAVIHGSIKPESVFLQATLGKPSIKLLGMGRYNLGRDIQGRALAYASPELLEGAAELTPRADVYSMGVVMFEALTGQLPVSGRSVEEVHRSILDAARPSLRELRSDLPADLAEVVDLAICRDPAKRHGGVKAMQAGLVNSVRAASEEVKKTQLPVLDQDDDQSWKVMEWDSRSLGIEAAPEDLDRNLVIQVQSTKRPKKSARPEELAAPAEPAIPAAPRVPAPAPRAASPAPAPRAASPAPAVTPPKPYVPAPPPPVEVTPARPAASPLPPTPVPTPIPAPVLESPPPGIHEAPTMLASAAEEESPQPEVPTPVPFVPPPPPSFASPEPVTPLPSPAAREAVERALRQAEEVPQPPSIASPPAPRPLGPEADAEPTLPSTRPSDFTAPAASAGDDLGLPPELMAPEPDRNAEGRPVLTLGSGGGTAADSRLPEPVSKPSGVIATPVVNAAAEQLSPPAAMEPFASNLVPLGGGGLGGPFTEQPPKKGKGLLIALIILIVVALGIGAAIIGLGLLGGCAASTTTVERPPVEVLRPGARCPDQPRPASARAAHERPASAAADRPRPAIS